MKATMLIMVSLFVGYSCTMPKHAQSSARKQASVTREQQIRATCAMAADGAKKCGSKQTASCQAMRDIANGYCKNYIQKK